MAGVIDLPSLVQRVSLKSDTADAENETRGALTRIGDSSVKAGKVLTAGLTVPIVGMAVAGIKAASDLAESNSKVGVVFEENADKVRAFAEDAAKSLGISEQKALEATGTFGNLFRAIGLTTAQSADMSTKLVTLAADLASFNNANPEDVLLALRSGLLGETEPLRQFGVSLSAARIEAEALAIGLVKPVGNAEKITAATIGVEKANREAAKAMKEHGKSSLEYRDAAAKAARAEEALKEATAGSVPELDAAQKAQAAYSVIMKDTALAQGDFSRTADGLANSQRIAAAQFDDAKAKLGEGLLPVALKFVGVGTSLLGMFNDLSPSGQKVALTVALIAAALGPALIVMGKMVHAAQAVGSGLGTVVSAGSKTVGGIGRLVGGFRDAQVAESTFSGRLGSLGGVLRKAAGGFASAASAVGRTAVSVAQGTGQIIASMARASAAAVASGARMAVSFVATAASAVASAAAVAAAWIVAAAPFILVGVAVAAVVALIVKNWDTVKAATVAVWEGITGFLKGVWDGITAAATFVFNGIRAYFETVTGVYRAVFTTAFEGVRAFLGNVFNGMRVIVEGFVAVVRGTADTVAGVWRGVTNVFGEVKNFVGDRIGDIVGFVAGLPGRISGLVGSVTSSFRSIGSGILDGILDGLKATANFAVNFGKQIANALIDIVNRQIIERINRGVEFRIEVFGRGVDINPPDIPTIPRLATGGRFQGAFLAGERGPEIVTGPMPTGEVLNNQTSNRLLAAFGRGPQVVEVQVVKEIHSPITVESPADPEEIAAANRFRLLTSGT